MADRKKLPLSVALGTLLIPVSAFAASALVKDAPVVESPTTVATTAQAQTEAVFAPQTVSAADLTAACGVEGLKLVESEAQQSITAIQQAALDALREICVQEGMPLPGKPVPEPVTQTVVVANAAASAPSVSQGSSEHEAEHEEEPGHGVEDDD